ncbi:MAG: apolipoprotein N-acyltransferase [Deltaproteobacteria bacterium]|nr:apolipoprotein N-acyltransferase [Deltaproteobacteria bacterium]
MTSLAPTRRRVALGLYALFTLLSFPHELPGLGFFDLGLVCTWLGPAALVVGLDGLTPRAAAKKAFLASLLGHVFLFHWFIVVTVTYGGMPLGLGLLAPLVPAYWVAQFSALFGGLWAHLAGRRGAAFFGACAWVGVDWLRGVFLGGFPWATLGYGLHEDAWLLPWTRFGGVYALCFVAAGVGLALGGLLLRGLDAAEAAAPESGDRRPGLLRSALGIALALALAHGIGAALAPAPASDRARVRIAAIQGNIDQGEKWDAARRERILSTYLRLSEQAADAGAAWIVWPETALPGSLEWDAGLAARVGELARRHAVTLVLGGMGIEWTEGREQPSAYYDSAFVVDAEGGIRDRYDKTQLVPFGEFVPLRGLLGRVFQSLARGLSPNDVTPGAAPRAVELPGSGGERPALRAGVPICYELIFPDLVRRFAADGAGVLLAVTNDAWYGRTGAPHQFLAMTAMRSAETGLFTVRAANTGISAIVDDRGRVREQSRLFEEAVIVADVPVIRTTATVATADGSASAAASGPVVTFYSRFGDVFAWSCILGALAGLVGSRARGGDRSSKGMDGHER